MRGYPPVHLLLLMLAFGALAVPLVNLTTARKAVAVERPAAASTTYPTLIRLRFAHVPVSVSLKMGDKELLQGASLAASPVEVKVELGIPADGIEFILTAAWPEGTPDTALTLELWPDGLDTKSETRWSLGGTMTEVMAFQWK